MQKDIVISPIFYMGNKKKLINKDLVEMFPKDIDTFVDLFSGSAIVSMNVNAKKYILNDINEKLFDFYNMFKNKKHDEIVEHILSNIDRFNMIQERTKENPLLREKQKVSYKNLRNHANETKDILDLYSCMFFAFSQQMRFNNKGEFNMPCGNDMFSEKNQLYIKNGCDFFQKNIIEINCKNFKYIDFDLLKENDFIYLDPPYLNTTATYNENGGWSTNDDLYLFELLEDLHGNGIKWGMSNVFSCKGKENTHLIEWCEKNNWNVFKFDKFSYMACGKGNSQATEVFICNYEIK